MNLIQVPSRVMSALNYRALAAQRGFSDEVVTGLIGVTRVPASSGTFKVATQADHVPHLRPAEIILGYPNGLR
jgi:hypothetical protein